jgi:hypothetical protein
MELRPPGQRERRLHAEEVARLVEEHICGAGIDDLADRDGINRTTSWLTSTAAKSRVRQVSDE